MRLFHVSEEAGIGVFHPRKPSRADLDPEIGLVWAIDEARLPNFLTPRDCPRVTCHVGPETSPADRAKYFPGTARHLVALEREWLPAMRTTTLYLYEFDPAGFVLQDEIAGYYVSTKSQTPIEVHRADRPEEELARRGVELRTVDSLWPLCREIQATTLRWSMCRMRNAKAEG